ncbi:hypothetical protein KVR01_007428 [Diaporthe batatas]|uniref:uncharacterized protein n=1 Tax=Diaporthe batatas TaxID=748121 RepID=UPI001D059DB8|nr:uncharacterized protein KVR01_007428 [Diaporthe batatas]KAG8162950.1 hypothetical protein KVR01_007428 [Diaporthe batatas]
MNSSPAHNILIIGATGQQGRSVIAALLHQHHEVDGSSPQNGTKFEKIFALTRSKESRQAKELASSSSAIHLVAGDLADPEAIFSAVGEPVWDLYSVQINANAEETQGIELVNAALRHGVRHFVYASGDRGGPVKSDTNPTPVRNFRAKFNIENHLKAVCLQSTSAMTFTILRPVTFFENLGGELHGRGFARMWEQMGHKGKKLQFVATKDIGWFAAQSFANPESTTFRNQAVTLVGDELTQEEAEIIFRKAMNGHSMPLAPCPIGSMVKWDKKDTVGDMFELFEKEGIAGHGEL